MQKKKMLTTDSASSVSTSSQTSDSPPISSEGHLRVKSGPAPKSGSFFIPASRIAQNHVRRNTSQNNLMKTMSDQVEEEKEINERLRSPRERQIEFEDEEEIKAAQKLKEKVEREDKELEERRKKELEERKKEKEENERKKRELKETEEADNRRKEENDRKEKVEKDRKEREEKEKKERDAKEARQKEESDKAERAQKQRAAVEERIRQEQIARRQKEAREKKEREDSFKAKRRSAQVMLVSGSDGVDGVQYKIKTSSEKIKEDSKDSKKVENLGASGDRILPRSLSNDRVVEKKPSSSSEDDLVKDRVVSVPYADLMKLFKALGAEPKLNGADKPEMFDFAAALNQVSKLKAKATPKPFGVLRPRESLMDVASIPIADLVPTTTNVFIINYDGGRKSLVFDPDIVLNDVLTTFAKTHGINLHDYVVSTVTGEGVPLNAKLNEIPGAEINIAKPSFFRPTPLEIIEKLQAEKKLFCHVCFQKVEDGEGEEVDNAFDGHALVHKKCFKCQNCSKELTQSDYTLNINEINCLNCFVRDNGKVCRTCEKEIDVTNHLSFLKLGISVYHVKADCLKCSSCSTSLVDSNNKLTKVVPIGDEVFCFSCSLAEKKKPRGSKSKGSRLSVILNKATKSEADGGESPTNGARSPGHGFGRTSSLSKLQVSDRSKAHNRTSSMDSPMPGIQEGDESGDEMSRDPGKGKDREGSVMGPKLKKGPKNKPAAVALPISAPLEAPELKSERMLDAAAEIKSALASEHWHLHFSDIHFEKKLGKGVTATVYLARYKETETVAVKLIRMEDAEKDLDSFKKELIIMSQLNHPNIVKFYGATLEPKMCFVIEYCPNGTLTDYLQAPDKEMNWDIVVQMSYEIALGVGALHEFDPPVVHRDLKSMNILLSEDLTCKVADFGLSRYTKPSLIKALQRQDTLATLRGTYMYTAPEIYHKKDYAPASDLYSMGIIIWEMCSRVVSGSYVRPFSEYPQLQFDFQVIYAAAVQNTRPTIPDGVPKELFQIISDCFKGEPEERPSCSDIVKILMKINRKTVKNLFGLIKQ